MLVWQFGYVPYLLKNAVNKGNFRTIDFQQEKQRIMLNMSSQYLGALAGANQTGTMIDKSGNSQDSLEAKQLLSKFANSDFGAIIQNALDRAEQRKEEALDISYGDMSVMPPEEIQKMASQDLQFVSNLAGEAQQALDYLGHFFNTSQRKQASLLVDELYGGKLIEGAISGTAIITHNDFSRMAADKRQVIESYMQLKRQIKALKRADSGDAIMSIAQSISNTLRQADTRCESLARKEGISKAVRQVKKEMVDITENKEIKSWTTTNALTIKASSMDQGLKKDLENAAKTSSFSNQQNNVSLTINVDNVVMNIEYLFNAEKTTPDKPKFQKLIPEQKTNLGAILDNLIANSIVSRAYVTTLAGVHEEGFSIDPTPYQAWNSMVDLGVSLSFMDYLRSVSNGPAMFFIVNNTVFPAKQLLETVIFGNGLSYEGGKQRAKFYKMSEWRKDNSNAPNEKDALERSDLAAAEMQQGFAATLMTVKMNIAAMGL